MVLKMLDGIWSVIKAVLQCAATFILMAGIIAFDAVFAVIVLVSLACASFCGEMLVVKNDVAEKLKRFIGVA